MGLNKEAIKIGFAYVGIVVGAGFSTGQEVMQFFTPFGLWSYVIVENNKIFNDYKLIFIIIKHFTHID
ncbi:hypothetical protein D9V13_03590 [Staphylococcus epidermidis]|nr:hypothetical protein D9V13_03590 [Staphylococcus epidermidis]